MKNITIAVMSVWNIVFMGNWYWNGFYKHNHIKKLKTSGEKWAIYAKNKDEIFLSNALKADFILLEDNELAIFASKVAEFYLFDSKILLILDELKNLEKAYNLGVDGVVLRDFIS